MGTIIFLIIILIAISGFFSGSETGLTAISKATVHKLDKEGNKKAKMVKRLQDDSEGLIGTILLGNNAVNIAASALATTIFLDWFGENGVAYATIFMTFLVLIFAEVMPKTYAIQQNEKVALVVAPIFIVLVKIFSPITKTIQKIVNFLFKILGHDPEETGSLLSATDAIRGTIELHHSEGKVEKHYKDMLGGVLDLGEIDVGEILVHRKDMLSIDGNLPMAEIIKYAVENNHSRYPIWKDEAENIIGMLDVKNMLQAIADNGGVDGFTIEDIISDAWFVPESTLVSDQLKAFLDKKKKQAVVVDEYGALEGLITLEDIIEEIVGNIQDETEAISEEVEVTKTVDDSYIISGSSNIRDINRQFGWRLDDEEASTISGLIMDIAQKIPEVGEKFTISDIEFEVLAIENNCISKVEASAEDRGQGTDDK